MNGTAADDTMLRMVTRELMRSYNSGIEDGSIILYETSRVHTIHESGIDYKVHLIPSLSSKPSPTSSLPDLINKPSFDPFEPPFPPAELIGVMDDYTDEPHYALLNKYCFLPAQWVLATKHWAVQNDPLDEDDLWITSKVVREFQAVGTPTFAFYNCGDRSAATQPHRHIQFLPSLDGQAPPTEILALSLNLKWTPITRPTRLPLPYIHYITSLPPLSLLTPSLLHQIYLTSLALHPPHLTSHNLLLTSHHLHTIPRSEREVYMEGEVRLGPNGLGFGGWFFMNPLEEQALEKYSVGRALSAVGAPNSEYKP